MKPLEKKEYHASMDIHKEASELDSVRDIGEKPDQAQETDIQAPETDIGAKLTKLAEKFKPKSNNR